MQNPSSLNKCSWIIVSCPPHQMNITDQVSNVVTRQINGHSGFPGPQTASVERHRAFQTPNTLLQIITETNHLIGNIFVEIQSFESWMSNRRSMFFILGSISPTRCEIIPH